MSEQGKKRIFLDYAAATPMSEQALDAYTQAVRFFANPQALHTEGLEAAKVLDEARGSIAKILGIKSHELIFTSGGTESNNIAIAGYLTALSAQGVELSTCHVVTSSIEHPSVSEVLEPFVVKGLSVTYVEPNEHGEIKPEAVKEALKENTVLVTIALVNSEIGTVQPMHAISAALNDHATKVPGLQQERPILHTDACQGLYQSLVPQGLGVDMLSIDAGKMYGPRGIGAVYIRRGTIVTPVLRGGSQEQGIRPGTENTALAAGFAAAFIDAHELRHSESERLNKLRNKISETLQEKISGVLVNGDGKNQSPHILNISIEGIDAEYVAMYLDQRGIALSTKSACLERSDAAVSHVVKALGGEAWRAKNTLRLSFGRATQDEDIEFITDSIQEAVSTYRSF